MLKKILIVDDNAINRRALKESLCEQYDILEATNGKEALAALHACEPPPSAVLLDIFMPEMDGYEALRRIRDCARLAGLPVIIVTGYEDEDSRVKALSLGANDFILKPFNPEIVKHCLKNNIALCETARTLEAIQRDKLTGLYSREAFFNQVERMIAEREPGYYVLSCFDIDHFKLINDQYGVSEGDRILREVGKAVARNAEAIGGVAGRVSADNFGVLLACNTQTTEVMQRILEKNLVSVEGQKLTFSIGRYVIRDISLPASAIWDRAFIAKQSVKGRYDEHLAYFDREMLERLLRDQQMTGEMETALKENQFEAWYQPQYNHATGALLGVEALARWRHPRKGLILPTEFVPLFEKNGFVYELDKYIWQSVCAQVRAWMDMGIAPPPVSVNISRYDLLRGDFIPVLRALVQKYALPMEMLRLEITESAFSSSEEGVVNVVKQLIALGFTVEIDDFGSGYSSLNTLKNVPAQAVKLDMRFLEGKSASQRGGSILEAIVRMTTWLGMSVLAEGVEKPEQADFLKSIGCTHIQGFLYARPMPASEFEALLRKAKVEAHAAAPDAVAEDAFWDPDSVDSMVFNKYSGGACVFEFFRERMELIRVTENYIRAVFGEGMSAADALKLNWNAHMDAQTAKALWAAAEQSVNSKAEMTGEYRFFDLPGCPRETYLRCTLRVIARADERILVYMTCVNITRQREAEMKNAAVASQLQAIMDHVGCGITAVTYGENGPEYILINNRYFELLGYTREQYARVETFSPIYEADRPQVIEASKQVYETGNARTIEYRAVKHDGQRIWMRVSMTMTRLIGIDRPVQLGMFFDITSERQATSELMDTLPNGAALYEYDGTRIVGVHINKRYWELVNRPALNYAGRNVEESVHPQDKGIVRTELASAISQKRDMACDLRIRSGKEGYRPFHVTGRITPKADGKYAISAVFTPITNESMSIQEMLPIALKAVMDKSSDISFVKGKDLRYISCSRKFAHYAGCDSIEDLHGKNSADVFPPGLAAQYDAVDREVLKSGQSHVDLDILFPTEFGEKHLLFSKYPLLGANGETLGVYGTGHDVTEARKAKTWLELLTNNIPGGIAVYEGNLNALDKIKLTYFTDGFCRLFGYERQEYETLARVNPLGHVFPEDITKMVIHAGALVRDGVPMDYVYRARTRDGEMKWINVKAVMGEPSGEMKTVNAVFFDVTQQRNALEKLRVSEEINRLAIQQSKNVVCRYDVRARSLAVSPNVDPIFRESELEEDVPHKFIREGRISPDTKDEYAAFFESIQRGEKSGEVLFQIKSTIGWRWAQAHFTTIFSDEGKPVTAVITYTDVTESIEKDAAYKKWQQSIRDRDPHSYSMYHCNVTKDMVLDATEGLLLPEKAGASAQNLSRRTAEYMENCVYSEDRERFLAVMDRSIQLMRYAQGRRTDVLEYREKLSEGGLRWLRLTVDLVDSPYNAEVEAYLMFENIDEAKKRELMMIERAETDPLTGILNRTTFAAKVDMVIDESKPGARHALLMLDIDSFKLVNDIFGHGAGDQTLVDIATILRNSSRRGDLVGRLGGDEFVVFLSNIPGEAAAARKAQQICELTRKDLGMDVRISASVGIAMSPEQGESFEALYKKADETLYSVKGSGKDNYAFCREDKIADEAEPLTGETVYSEPRIGRKRRILIVDDNKIDAEVLFAMFSGEYIVEKCMDGISALVKLRHYGSAISVVLLDLMMPDMDGFAVLEKMQSAIDMKSIPVIVVSGANDHETGLKAIRAGAADFITKPVDSDVLRIRVQSAISRAENERLRAQNNFLALQSSEINSYKTALERSGTLLVVYDWTLGTFIYSPSIGKNLCGKYDGRTLWHILLSDMVADSKTVQKMQQLAHDIANDRSRMDGCMTARLKSASGEAHMYQMNVYKQVSEYGLTDKLILTFKKEGAPADGV